jgi:chromatin remodeling complex protein RSC6
LVEVGQVVEFHFKLIKMNTKTEKKSSHLQKVMELSDEMADLVGMKESSVCDLVVWFWDYIRKQKLQDPENRHFLLPDRKLAKVLGTERLRGFTLPKYIWPHMKSAEHSKPREKTAKKSAPKGGRQHQKKL